MKKNDRLHGLVVILAVLWCGCNAWITRADYNESPPAVPYRHVRSAPYRHVESLACSQVESVPQRDINDTNLFFLSRTGPGDHIARPFSVQADGVLIWGIAIAGIGAGLGIAGNCPRLYPRPPPPPTFFLTFFSHCL